LLLLLGKNRVLEISNHTPPQMFISASVVIENLRNTPKDLGLCTTGRGYTRWVKMKGL
jgi:hypothetical protein